MENLPAVQLAEAYKEFGRRIARLADLVNHEGWVREIEFVQRAGEDEELAITVTWYAHQQDNYETLRCPIALLDASVEEQREFIRLARQAERQRVEQARQEAEEAAKKRQEEYDRKAYERLKAKFEPPKTPYEDRDE